MNEKEAMKIFTSDINKYTWYFNEIEVYISPEIIKENLKCNDYRLNLDFIQDFTAVVDGNYEIFQGHSLSELTKTPE